MVLDTSVKGPSLCGRLRSLLPSDEVRYMVEHGAVCDFEAKALE